MYTQEKTSLILLLSLTLPLPLPLRLQSLFLKTLTQTLIQAQT